MISFNFIFRQAMLTAIIILPPATIGETEIKSPISDSKYFQFCQVLDEWFFCESTSG